MKCQFVRTQNPGHVDRRRRWAVAGTCIGVGMSLLGVTPVLAAPAFQTGAGLANKIETVANQLASFARPLALLAVVIVLISWVAEPMIPDWARENRGMLAKDRKSVV